MAQCGEHIGGHEEVDNVAPDPLQSVRRDGSTCMTNGSKRSSVATDVAGATAGELRGECRSRAVSRCDVIPPC
jgi:hypothetical protein